jgi:DNA-binding Lrp family transcriptional regulator
MSNNWYITIPSDLLQDNQLSNTEKILLSLINNLQQADKVCTASNKYLSKYINVTPCQVSVLITQLINKKYIIRSVIYNDKKQVIRREMRVITKVYKKCNQPYIDKPKEGIEKNPKVNNKLKYINSSVNKIVMNT